MAEELINVFVSHFHEDEESIKAMKNLLGDKYNIRNYSVTSDKYNNAKNEEYIKSMLRDLIRKSGTFICLIGPDTHDSKWVNWEIEQAFKQGKRIIGVYTWGAKDSDIPPALEDAADAMVGWNHDTIVKAIERDNLFINADGSIRPNVGGSRVTC
jgi:MTH538 TIR-like domain (DUF1863).